MNIKIQITIEIPQARLPVEKRLHVAPCMLAPVAPMAKNHILIEIPQDIYNEAFAPLLRDREVPWMHQAQTRADYMRAARQHYASFISHEIAQHIV